MAGYTHREIRDAAARIGSILRTYDRMLVAFSGGVDSALVVHLAHRFGRTLAVTGDSPTLPRCGLRSARAFCERYGIPHRVIRTGEMFDPAYTANTGDRCYHCKSDLYGRLDDIARSEGYDVVLDGTNADDLLDTRPGIRAAREHGTVSPLCQAGISKEMVRAISRSLGLPTWDMPSSACLASRVPRGRRITLSTLSRIERSESILRDAGFRVVRVRDHYPEARLELGEVDLERVRLVAPRLREVGYRHIMVSSRGYVEPHLKARLKDLEEELYEIQ